MSGGERHATHRQTHPLVSWALNRKQIIGYGLTTKLANLSITESQRGGSNPPLTAKWRGGLEMVPARSHKPNDASSNLALATKYPQATGS